MKPGLFIAVEGIDGCGKTTQIQSLAEWLPTSGLMPSGAVLAVTREPGGTPFGSKLRDMILHPAKGEELCPKTELLLFMADRAQHIESRIKPVLDRGHWILCDRFNASTFAYQGFGRGWPLKEIQLLQDFACKNIKPDLTLWIDISVDEALKRTKDKQPDRIEAEGAKFLEKVREGFCQLYLANQVVKINGSCDVELVTQECKNHIDGYVRWSNALES